MLIAIGTILIFSPFANNVRTAAPIATGTVRWKGSEGSKLAKHTTRKLTPW